MARALYASTMQEDAPCWTLGIGVQYGNHASHASHANIFVKAILIDRSVWIHVHYLTCWIDPFLAPLL